MISEATEVHITHTMALAMATVVHMPEAEAVMLQGTAWADTHLTDTQGQQPMKTRTDA